MSRAYLKVFAADDKRKKIWRLNDKAGESELKPIEKVAVGLEMLPLIELAVASNFSRARCIGATMSSSPASAVSKYCLRRCMLSLDDPSTSIQANWHWPDTMQRRIHASRLTSAPAGASQPASRSKCRRSRMRVSKVSSRWSFRRRHTRGI